MAPDASTTSYIIWLVRVVLPIVLFFFWYRSQPKAERTDNAYDREDLLEARRAPPDEEPPAALQRTMKLYDEATLIAKGVFGEKPRAPRRETQGNNKAGGKKGSGKGKDSTGAEGKGGPRRDSGADLSAAVVAPADESLLSEEERMHIESLLNFVAFAHKEQPQRTFLPNEQHRPPPPKRLPPIAMPEADPSDAALANSQVQLVLKGVVNSKLGLKKCDYVARALNDKLLDTHVTPTEATFSLMVEACVISRDLKGASEFLMKMETSGHCPSSELLDKVMDLYSESRTDPKSPSKDLLSGTSKTPWWGVESTRSGEDFDDAPAMKNSALGSLSGPVSLGGLSLRPGGSLGSAAKKATPPPWAAKPKSTGSPEFKPTRQSWDDMRMDEFEFDN